MRLVRTGEEAALGILRREQRVVLRALLERHAPQLTFTDARNATNLNLHLHLKSDCTAPSERAPEALASRALTYARV